MKRQPAGNSAGGQFMSGDARKSEAGEIEFGSEFQGVSDADMAWATYEAENRHSDWRKSAMDESGWCKPVMFDGQDIANTPYERLSPDARRAMVVSALRPGGGTNEELQGADMYHGTGSERLYHQVAEHEAIGGSIVRQGDHTLWLKDGVVYRDGGGYGIYSSNGARVAVDGDKYLFSESQDSVSVRGVGSFNKLREGERYGSAQDFENNRQIVNGVIFEGDRSVPATDSEVEDEYHRIVSKVSWGVRAYKTRYQLD